MQNEQQAAAVRESLGDNFDVIVVGAGSAGIPCALTAAERGARVLVIEKAAEIGGTLHLSGGHMSAAGTRRQRERDIADTVDAHFADVMRIARHEADPVLVRLAVAEAPHTIDWLDELGLPWDPVSPRLVYGHEAYQVPRTYYGLDAGRSILATLRPGWDAQVATGRITLLLNTALTELVCEQGAVCGVKVHAAQGASVWRGKAVVLTTGGYAANAAFFRTVTPGQPKLITTARAHSQGEGIQAAQRLGAVLQHADKYLPSLGGIELEPGSGRADYAAAWALVFTTKYRAPREIYVNTHGERFMAEDDPSPDLRERMIVQQPAHQFWCIWDETAMSAGASLVRQWDEQQLRAHCAAGKCAWQADSLTELAQQAGIDAAGLVMTVAQFNEAARTGADVFGRTDLAYPILQPPFYALLTHATSLITFGGLRVDGELRVVNETGQPIPNLYAAGEILGAAVLMGQSYCGGMMQTPAISFGRLLGQRLSAGHPKS